MRVPPDSPVLDTHYGFPGDVTYDNQNRVKPIARGCGPFPGRGVRTDGLSGPSALRAGAYVGAPGKYQGELGSISPPAKVDPIMGLHQGGGDRFNFWHGLFVTAGGLYLGIIGGAFAATYLKR